MRMHQQIVPSTRTARGGRWLASLAAFTLLPVGTVPNLARGAEKTGQSSPVQTAHNAFDLAGKTIRVELFEPTAPGKCPAIILLPAVDGVDGVKAYGSIYRLQARKYAGKGCVVLLVHYFDSTDVTKEEWKAIQGRFRLFFGSKSAKNPPEMPAMRQHFKTWVDTVREAVRYAATLPKVDPKRIGLVGFSLGASLALAVAGEERPKDRKIATVVSLFGSLPPEMREGIRGLPPTLMIQGDMDERVPPWTAYDFERWLIGKDCRVEFRMLPRVGHGFDGARLEDIEHGQILIEAFLRTRLKPRAPGHPRLDAPVSRQGDSPARR